MTRRDVFIALLCRSVLLTQRGHCGFWYDAIKHHRVQLMRFALPPNEAADLATLPEIFMNASIPEEPLRGPFGVCYVAFAGTHERRYRGERILEVAATQLRAAAATRGASIEQCVFTDQPERPRPYVQLSVALKTPLDGAPFASLCGEYTRRFDRPCKLLFGYMAKAIAAARPPYTSTVFVDTDTFVCDAAPLIAMGQRLLANYDVLLHMPRTTQGWVNSGVLGVRRSAARRWATAWQREFTSLDDFGDQLHLLKVLPQLSGGSAFERGSTSIGASGGAAKARGAGAGSLRAGSRGGGRGGNAAFGRGKARGGARGAAGTNGRAAMGRQLSGQTPLAVGELPPELHFRVGGVPEGGTIKLPPLRGPPMLIHSKGLAALGGFIPFFADRFGSALAMAGGMGAARQQLLEALGGPLPEGKRKGEHALYSSRALAGFCLMLTSDWSSSASSSGSAQLARRLVLNSNGTCVGCTALPKAMGAVGTIVEDARKTAEPYFCTETSGSCAVVPAVWPSGSERALPDWFRKG